MFLAGIGAHFPGTIEEHTKHVLDEMEQNLIRAGSSMEKVLKVNVYLSDLENYARMNSVYGGRWGMSHRCAQRLRLRAASRGIRWSRLTASLRCK